MFGCGGVKCRLDVIKEGLYKFKTLPDNGGGVVGNCEFFRRHKYMVPSLLSVLRFSNSRPTF